MNGKLVNHREALAGNIEAYSFEIKDKQIRRLVNTIVPHLKNAGYKNVSAMKHFDVLTKVIKMIFLSQDSRPIFHVEGTELPLCWNSPKDWDKNYIKYEWGHLRSRNQAGHTSFQLENLGLYSARCNQHIQTSMHIEELMIYGGILAQRISNILTARRKLFESDEWKQQVELLNYCKIK